jgi:hypothetical protein
MDHKGWHSRGYLPHFDSQDVVQFVTFRLADSLPKEAVLKLRGTARPESLRDELLDQGLGACWLRSDPIARIVEDAFLVFDGERYSPARLDDHAEPRACASRSPPRHAARHDRQLVEALHGTKSEQRDRPNRDVLAR